MNNANKLLIVISALALALGAAWASAPGAQAKEGEQGENDKAAISGKVTVSRETLKRILDMLSGVAARLEKTEPRMAGQIRDACERASQLALLGKLDEATRLIRSGEYLTARDQVGQAGMGIKTMVEILIKMPEKPEGIPPGDLQEAVRGINEAVLRQAELVEEAVRLGKLAVAQDINAGLDRALEQETKLAEQIPAGTAGKEPAEMNLGQLGKSLQELLKDQQEVRKNSESAAALDDLTETGAGLQEVAKRQQELKDLTEKLKEKAKEAVAAAVKRPQQQGGDKIAAQLEQVPKTLDDAAKAMEKAADQLSKSAGRHKAATETARAAKGKPDEPQPSNADKKMEEARGLVKEADRLQQEAMTDQKEAERQIAEAVAAVGRAQEEEKAVRAASRQAGVPQPLGELAKEQAEIKADTEKVKEALDRLAKQMKATETGAEAAQSALASLQQAAENMDKAAEALQKGSGAQNSSPQQEQSKKEAQAAAEQAKKELQKARESMQKAVEGLEKKDGKTGDPKEDLEKLAEEQKELQENIEKLEGKSGKSPNLEEAKGRAKEAAGKFKEAKEAAQRAGKNQKNKEENEKARGEQKEALKKGEEEARKAEEALRKEKELLEKERVTAEQMDAVKKTQEALADILKQQEEINANTLEKSHVEVLTRQDRFDIVKISQRQELLSKKTKELAGNVKLQEATVVMSWLLNQISDEMLQVSTMLFQDGKFEVGEPTQQRQKDIAEDLRALITALEEVSSELKEKQKEQEQQEQEREEGGEEGVAPKEGKKQMGLIPVAELKVLKYMEEKLHKQTVRFQKEHPDAAKYTVAEVTRIESLKRAQSEIKDLSNVLIEQAEEAVKAAN